MPTPVAGSSQAVWSAVFWLNACWTCAVLPDLEHWDDHFAHVKFDGDPTEDVQSIARLSEDDKHRVAGMCSPSFKAIWNAFSGKVTGYKFMRAELQAKLALSAVPDIAMMDPPSANPAFLVKRRLKCEGSAGS